MAGILGIYANLDSTLESIEELKRQNFRDLDVYSPAPRPELEDAVKPPISPVRVYTLIGGLLGATFGYWVAIWTSEYWPLVVGGKAMASWIPYTIIGFEMFVLVGSLATVAGMFINSRIPKLTLTVGFDTRFTHGSYGIFVRCTPERESAAESLLRQYGAEEVRSES